MVPRNICCPLSMNGAFQSFMIGLASTLIIVARRQSQQTACPLAANTINYQRYSGTHIPIRAGTVRHWVGEKEGERARERLCI